MTAHIPLLGDDPEAPFPPVASAMRKPYDGLLAAGGDLHPSRLLNAYRHGIFPWYSEGEPLLWWSPNPRMVFRTEAVRLSTRYRRQLRQCDWHIRADTVFDQVIVACASMPRSGQRGTWITREMIDAYRELHRLGHAHSVEVFSGTELIGGIYGVAIGRMFFGESMVSLRSGGSKAAIAALACQLQTWGWPLIDAQVQNEHLLTLGAENWPRAQFLASITELVAIAEPAGAWTDRFGEIRAEALASRCSEA